MSQIKKRVKIFEAGNYPQGDYPVERVKKIFETAKDKLITAIFQHTSKWKKAGKQPVTVGEFGNIQIQDDGKVFADVSFNEKGAGYFEDGILNAVSVEIPGDTLTAISILPVGVNPAVVGAEFEGNGSFYFEVEFEDTGGETVGLAEVLAALGELPLEDKLELIRAIGRSITPDQKQAFRVVSYEFAEIVKNPEKEKSEELKMAEAKLAEFEKKDRTQKVASFLEKNKTKITPAIKPELEEFANVIVQQSGEFEFAEGSRGQLFDQLLRIYDKMPDVVITKEIVPGGEFEEDELVKTFNEAAKRTRRE